MDRQLNVFLVGQPDEQNSRPLILRNSNISILMHVYTCMRIYIYMHILNLYIHTYMNISCKLFGNGKNGKMETF